MFTSRVGARPSQHNTTSMMNLNHTNFNKHKEVSDIHQTNDTMIGSLKGHQELSKLRSQAFERRSSLENLLKRTEDELNDLNVTEDVTTSFNDENLSLVSGISNLSSNYH